MFCGIQLISPSSVEVSVAENWDPSLGGFLDKLYQHHPKNLDHNSGHPLGVSICQVSAFNGHRTTASGAYLSDPPSNLTIMTGTAVTRILFQDQKAVGLELPGKKSQTHLPSFDLHRLRLLSQY